RCSPPPTGPPSPPHEAPRLLRRAPVLPRARVARRLRLAGSLRQPTLDRALDRAAHEPRLPELRPRDGRHLPRLPMAEEAEHQRDDLAAPSQLQPREPVP